MDAIVTAAPERHAVFKSLPAGLREIVVGWVRELVTLAVDFDPEVTLERLDDLAWKGEAARGLPAEQLSAIQIWLESREEEELLAMVIQAFHEQGKTRRLPRATPEQIEIILESQEQLGIRWTGAELKRLTSWQADVLIKGLIVVHEVKRLTGSRQFTIRQLRQALRTSLEGARPERRDNPVRPDGSDRSPRWNLPSRS